MQSLVEHDLYWCRRRMPTAVLELLKKCGPRAMIAGGFIRSCVSGEPINDVDIFAPSVEAAKAMADDLVAGKPNRKLINTDNAITVTGLRVPVQFIHRWVFDNPATLVQSFDFTIASAVLWYEPAQPAFSDGEKGCPERKAKWGSLCDDRFYPDLASKRLVYRSPIRNEDAGGSMLRVLKFYQRGYRIPLDSLGAVIARLVGAVDLAKCGRGEGQVAKVLTGLLREVDPNIDPDHSAHLPSDPTEQG